MLRNAMILCFFVSSCFAMDPTIAQGASRVRLSFNQNDATSYFDQNALSTPLELNGRPADYEHNAYQLEYTYGYTADIAIIVRTEQDERTLKTSQQNVSQSGISDYYVGMRQRLGSSANAHLFVETGVLLGQKDTDPLPLSSGGTSWLMMLSYAQVFAPSRAGFEMDGGYVRRGGDASDEIRFKSRLHLDFLEVVDITVGYSVIESQRERQIAYNPTTWPNERGLQEASLELSRNLGNNFQVDLGYHALMKGRNQFDTDGYQLGFTWWLNP